MMKGIDPKQFIDKASISYHYADYEKDQWTVPVKMTREKLEEVYEDLSITAIRIFPYGEKTYYYLHLT